MKHWLPLFLALLPSFCFGQAIIDSTKAHSPLLTDRPDQTEASSVLPLGTLQVETGLLQVVDRKNGFKTQDVFYPTTLIRWGILERMELRFLAEYRKTEFRTEKGLESAKGFNAFAIGTKISIAEEKGLLPEIAFIGHLTLPSGASEFKPTYVAPDFRLSLSHTLSNTFGLGYNVGYEWDGESPEGAGIYTLSLGAGLGERWGAYAEVFGEKPQKGNWSHSTDAGLTFTPRYNVQLDVSAGLGLNEEAPDYYLSAGISFRIPK